MFSQIDLWDPLLQEAKCTIAIVDELLKAKRKFTWTAEYESSFTSFKQIIRSPNLLLSQYNPPFAIVALANAPSVGVEATISHKIFRWVFEGTA